MRKYINTNLGITVTQTFVCEGNPKILFNCNTLFLKPGYTLLLLLFLGPLIVKACSQVNDKVLCIVCNNCLQTLLMCDGKHKLNT